ncbi:right-handed parallel beta-helix repeat-containing protein [Oceaniglobus roseus]|uniref:right-handed parallel beta-helix repeat-containing protein n=1 Tax=Oceaniglobus roseus TaxID=1737570 RepID=UPI000C7F3468|nr:right-handed parallel beta-helix repeat-containing protein [Kandeliimicrobium roseum]
MRDGLWHRLRRGGAGLALGLLAAAGASAAPDLPDAGLRSALEGLEESLVAPANAVVANLDLLRAAGLDGFAPAVQPGPLAMPMAGDHTSDPLEAQGLDVRLALTMLTQTAGATDNQGVLNAQRDPELRALVIRRGTARLSDIELLTRQYRLQPAEADNGGFVLRVPVVVWDGAALQIGPGETLRLSRPDGAFLINFGHLAIAGGSVESVGGANTVTGRFAPFVTTAASGTVQVDHARFTGLGFGKTLKFGGFSVMRNNMMVVRRASFVRDSLFDGLVSVALSGLDGVAVENNKFRAARGPALVVSGAREPRILSNIFYGKTEFNAIQVLSRSRDAVVSGNVVLGGEKTGIAVRRHSHNALVAGNIVWRREGGGITVAGSDCGRILGNLVLDNRHKGIEVRDSRGTVVADNRVVANQSAGIWVSAQQDDSETWLKGNVLSANRAGLSTATGASLVLAKNDFTQQYPRFLGGDLSRQSAFIAGDLAGEKAVTLTALGATPAPAGSADRPEDCRK